MGHLLPKGTKLDNRYVIEEVIGQGGFGITYVGKNQVINRKVAIKELYIRDFMGRDAERSPEIYLIDSSYRERLEKYKKDFLYEARVVGRFSSQPAVVDVIDYFQENGTAYIVMEYLEGITLSAFLKENKRIPARELFVKMLPLIETLEKIHENHVIHRDISPDNIMVKSNGELILMDFGASRNFADQDELSRVVKDGYAPVEQCGSGGKQGPWTDVYALCATMYQCITGSVPDSSVSRLLYDELKKPSDMEVLIDESLERILMKGLQVAPEARYQNLQDLIKEIRDVLPEGKDEAADESGKIPKKRRKWFIPIGACLLLAIGICIYFRAGYGKKTLEYDPETTYQIRLTADEEMSVKGFNEAVEILRERLDIFTGGEPYNMEVDEDTVELVLPKDAFADYDVTKILRCYLTRAIDLYAFNLADEESLPERMEIGRDDLEKVTLKEGVIEGIDASEYGVDADTYQYLEVVLTKEFAEANKEKIDEWGENFTFAQDMSLNSWYRYYTFPAGDGRTFYVLNNDVGGHFTELVEYNLAHDPLENGFYFNVTKEVEWQDPEEEAAAGKNQCTEDVLDEDAVTVFYYTTEELSQGETLDMWASLRERMDTLCQPYALGIVKDSGYEAEIAVKTGTGHMGTPIMKLLTARSGFYLQSGLCNKNIGTLDRTVSCVENAGGYGLQIDFSKDYDCTEIKELTAGAKQEGGTELYLSMGNLPYCSLHLDKPIADGSICFSELYFSGEESVDEESAWVLQLIETVCNGTAMEGYWSLDSYIFDPSEDGTEPGEEVFGISYQEDKEKLIEAVKSAVPKATVSVLDDETVSVQLHLAVDETLPQEGLSQAQKIYETADFENSIFTILRVILTEEEENERGRITFSKYISSKNGEIYSYGTFKNGRLERYKAAFAEAAEKDEFYRRLTREDMQWDLGE